MLPQTALSVLERWRPRFEADELLTMRDIKQADISAVFAALSGELVLPYLGHGSSRVAFGLDATKVLKVGFSRCGMQSNRREMAAAALLPTHLQAKVCGGADDGLWIVQERVTVLEDWPTGHEDEELERIRLEVEHAAPQGVCDAAPDNFGRLPDGRLVLVDIESLVPLGAVLQPGEAVARRFA